MNKSTLYFVLGVVIILLAGRFGWQEIKAQGADWLPIKYVRIEGAFQYIAKDKIKQVIVEQVKNGLYNANIQQIQQSVKQLPWAEKVNVNRVWPDAIDIKITEQTPEVRWGTKALLNNKGAIFVPENIKKFSHLPLLTGPKGNEKKLLKTMKELSMALSDQEMKLAEFSVNDRRAWKIKFQNGMNLILGRNEPLNKFQLFLKTFGLIGSEQVTKVAVVDLRYPNGYALTWKQGEEEIDWKKIVEINKYKAY
jgi:cell division protein FtsQ